MTEIKNLKINEMPKIKSDEDVEQLFEPGNFLYCIMKDNVELIKELKKTEEYNNINVDEKSNTIINEIAKLEWALIPHDDESIHDWKRPHEWYEYCGLPKFIPEGDKKPNDMLTSPSYAKKLKKRFDYNDNDKSYLNFLAVNHTIGNMLTAKRNWLSDIDVAAWKLYKIWKYYYENENEITEESQKEICKAYSEHKLTNEWNKLIDNLYLVDFCNINKTNSPVKQSSKLLLFYFPGDDNWGIDDSHSWLDNNTKLIIQRGYRMQLKYKEPEFTSEQKRELKIIFEYFEFKDTNVI